MAFDPDMTYWQSLKIVAKGIIQWPLSRHDLRELREALETAAKVIGGAILRITVLLLWPISAPLLTLAVQYDRKLTARRIAEARARTELMWSLVNKEEEVNNDN